MERQERSISNGVPHEEIRVIGEPSVYLVGRQQVDQAVVDRFLADHGATTWQTDTEVAGEHLAEIGGRLCYMSFARPRPGGNKAYLDHILQVGHGSVLEHAVWNFIFTGISRACSHELVRHRAGFGYCLTGDTLVYSDHFNGGKREGVKKRSLKRLYEMTLTPHGRSRLKLVRLRCLDETTGTFGRGRIKEVVYSGRKPVFRVCLKGGKTITCSQDHRFLTPKGWLPLHEIVGGLTVSTGSLAVHGPLDVPIATNGMPAYKDREWLRKRYVEEGMEQEEIGRLAGGSALTMHHVLPIWARPDLAHEITNIVPPCEPCHLRVNTRELEYAERLGGDPEAVRAIDPSSRPTGRGNLLVPRFRRVLRIVYAGEQDTYDIEMEGPHHNFVANGIVTHNSQLSQRYVDESIAEYVEPDVIAADADLHALWLDAVAHAHNAYVKLVEKLTEKFHSEPDRTLRRKLARQAARSVLPNATETKIFVSANARALRHFIEMRASRHAEVEIRKLAVGVLRIMQVEAPNLFSDYQLVPLGDGTFEADTPHRKV
jgi:thymidylate synthase ThyX